MDSPSNGLTLGNFMYVINNSLMNDAGSGKLAETSVNENSKTNINHNNGARMTTSVSKRNPMPMSSDDEETDTDSELEFNEFEMIMRNSGNGVTKSHEVAELNTNFNDMCGIQGEKKDFLNGVKKTETTRLRERRRIKYVRLLRTTKYVYDS